MTNTTLDWRGDVPLSKKFNDVYYSMHDGLAESRFVYLSQNGLPGRFTRDEYFHVLEIGFGTGLNFLATWEAWDSIGRPGRLVYTSCELYPLTLAEIRRSLSAWPELKSYVDALGDVYERPEKGFHRYDFCNGLIILTLLIGDAAVTLPEYVGQADAVYYDGFAPSRDPDVWSSTIMQCIARLCHSGTTLSTYSSASAVRKRLEEAGFAVEKIPGFSGKREMTRARFVARSESTGQSARRARSHGRIAIIGGGLAGTAIVHALAKRGLRTALYEARQGLASAASGNPTGIVHPVLTRTESPLFAFSIRSYLFAMRHFRRMSGSSVQWNPCGVLQLMHDEETTDRLSRAVANLGLSSEIVRMVSAAEAAEIAGLAISSPGIYFPQAGTASPVGICTSHVNLREAMVDLHTRSRVQEIRRENEVWLLYGDDGHSLGAFEQIIFCNAAEAISFGQLSWLPLRPVRGQILYVHQEKTAGRPNCVVCYDGYFTPAVNGWHVAGATYETRNFDEEVNPEQNRELLRNACKHMGLSPLQEAMDEGELKRGRVSFRTSCVDTLPVIGRLPDRDAFLALNKQYSPGAIANMPYLPGLHVSLSHASRGLTTSILAAEMIASEICGEPSPVEKSIAASVSPVRFLIRELKKKGGKG